MQLVISDRTNCPSAYRRRSTGWSSACTRVVSCHAPHGLLVQKRDSCTVNPLRSGGSLSLPYTRYHGLCKASESIGTVMKAWPRFDRSDRILIIALLSASRLAFEP